MEESDRAQGLAAPATKHALRALARPWHGLQVETKEYEEHLVVLTRSAVPAMIEAFGIGPDTAAEMLIVVGDEPDLVRSEPASARLRGVCPIPASSGMSPASG